MLSPRVAGAVDGRLSDAFNSLQSGNAKEAYPVLLALHKDGCAEASRLLGLMHIKGDGMERDPDKGMAYIKTASDAGNAEATFILAEMQPTIEDHAKTMQKAAKQGQIIAAQQIGLYYFKGEGVEVDKVKAYGWLFSVRICAVVAAESYTVPLAKLDAELSTEDKERRRVMAWNLVYIDTRSGWNQEAFDSVNSNLTGRISGAIPGLCVLGCVLFFAKCFPFVSHLGRKYHQISHAITKGLKNVKSDEPLILGNKKRPNLMVRPLEVGSGARI